MKTHPSKILMPWLLVCLCGCLASTASVSEEEGTPVRVIVTFTETPPPPNDPRLVSLLSKSCDCQPVFIRPYLLKGHIFQVVLRTPGSFATFAQRLKADGAALGISDVERDGKEL